MKFYLEDTHKDDFDWNKIIGKIFLCENGLILYGRRTFTEGLNELEEIGIKDDDINKYTWDDIIEQFLEKEHGKMLIVEYEPDEHQILSKRFMHENNDYWFFDKGELDDSPFDINNIKAYEPVKRSFQ